MNKDNKSMSYNPDDLNDEGGEYLADPRAKQSLHQGITRRRKSTLPEAISVKKQYEEMTTAIKNMTMEEKKRLKNRLILKSIKDARENFYSYVLLMAPQTIPEKFINGRHIKIICDSLQAVEESVVASQIYQNDEVAEELQRQAKRVQYFLPPGGMKSLLCSRLFVSWCFGRHPNWRFLQFGWGTDFAINNFGRPLKELLLSPEFQTLFPDLKLKADARRAQEFETTAGGTYFCAGAGAGVAGKRATIALCDDVLSEQTAFSKAERDKINKWYSVGPRQRLLPWGGEVLVNTRWHVDDLSGSRLKADGELGTDTANRSPRPWEVFRFEAILKKEGADLLGLNEGDSFWPELWPKSRLLEFKNDPEMPPSRWNALYMQNPTPEEGNIIKHEQWQKWMSPQPPVIDFCIASIDSAFSTSESADYSALTVWGVFHRFETDSQGRQRKVPNIILLEGDKGRWEFPELCSRMEKINHQHDPDLFIIEKKASGQSLIQEMRRRGFPVMPYNPEKDKITRLHACTGFFYSGRIWIPDGKPWADEVVEEVCGFPYAPHDDLTDTVSQAIIYMRDAWKIEVDEYPSDDDDDDDEDRGYLKRGRTTYWSSLTKD